MELTFALIKSKAIRHNLHGIVLSRIVESGLIIRHAEWKQLKEMRIRDFYAEHVGKPYWDDLQRSVFGHVIVLVISGETAVSAWRTLMGATDPKKAERGTIRALAKAEPMMADNIVHGSDSAESAEREIRLILGRATWHNLSALVKGA